MATSIWPVVETERRALGADEAVLARVREICGAFVDADEDSIQGRPLFHVRRRRFAIFNGESSPVRTRWREAGRSLHFLSDPEERDALLQDPRVTPSPHHGDRGWVAIRIDGPDSADWRELTELLAAAYEQVVSSRRRPPPRPHDPR